MVWNEGQGLNKELELVEVIKRKGRILIRVDMWNKYKQEVRIEKKSIGEQ